MNIRRSSAYRSTHILCVIITGAGDLSPTECHVILPDPRLVWPGVSDYGELNICTLKLPPGAHELSSPASPVQRVHCENGLYKYHHTWSRAFCAAVAPVVKGMMNYNQVEHLYIRHGFPLDWCGRIKTEIEGQGGKVMNLHINYNL